MTKSISTFERKMKDPKFRKEMDKAYKVFLCKELLICIQEDDFESIPALIEQLIEECKVSNNNNKKVNHDSKKKP